MQLKPTAYSRSAEFKILGHLSSFKVTLEILDNYSDSLVIR